jgi:hypothetical protein
VTGTAVNPGFLNLKGSITSVVTPLLETTATSPTVYDFSRFSAGNSIIQTYNKVGADFAAMIAGGGTITGTGGFSEVAIAVLEPTSLSILGIGMMAFLMYRREFDRRCSLEDNRS